MAELDAAAACRLYQVDKVVQQGIHRQHKDWVYAWRHARARLVLCMITKAHVLHRRAVGRGRVSIVWNHFTSVHGAAPSHVRCCCIRDDGIPCGIVLRVVCRALRNCGRTCSGQCTHPALYTQLRTQTPLRRTEPCNRSFDRTGPSGLEFEVTVQGQGPRGTRSWPRARGRAS